MSNIHYMKDTAHRAGLGTLEEVLASEEVRAYYRKYLLELDQLDRDYKLLWHGVFAGERDVALSQSFFQKDTETPREALRELVAVWKLLRDTGNAGYVRKARELYEGILQTHSHWTI